MKDSKLITPGSVAVPAVLSIEGYEVDGKAEPGTLRAKLALAALQGLCARESSSFLSAVNVGRFAVQAADAALAALRQPPASAIPPVSGEAEPGG